MNIPKCEICGEPMPEGEDMFKFHGYSGPCPKPPLKQETMPTDAQTLVIDAYRLCVAKGMALSQVLSGSPGVDSSAFTSFDAQRKDWNALAKILRKAIGVLRVTK